jgi:CRISPR-associated protein Cas2
MITAVSYDIVDNRRRRRMSKLLGQFGVRIQKSVFELDLEEKDLPRFVRRIEKTIDPAEDSVRIYRLTSEALKLSLWVGLNVEVHEKGYYII